MYDPGEAGRGAEVANWWLIGVMYEQGGDVRLVARVARTGETWERWAMERGGRRAGRAGQVRTWELMSDCLSSGKGCHYFPICFMCVTF